MVSAEVPKYLAISRDLESRIRAGHWGGGKLPSARELAGAHGVSLVTASRALQVLRDRGLVRTVDRSGSYVAAAEAPAPAPPSAVPSASPASGRWALCLRVTPGPWQRATLSIVRGGFEALARRRGLALEADPFESDDPLPPPELRRRARRAVEEGVSGVFLMPSRLDEEAARRDEALLDACRSAGLPVVLVERNLRGAFRPLECDLVATDDVEGGQLCTRHLLDRGRRRVAFVTGSPTSSHEGRLAGYLAALQQASASSGSGPESEAPWEPEVLSQRAGVPTQAAYRELADRVLARRIDGLVCYQDYTAIGLIMELLTRGVRVPHDVAITGFDDLPIGHSFALGVTTYAFPAEGVAAEALRVMRRRIEEPAAPPIKVLVPGALIVRESSVPA